MRRLRRGMGSLLGVLLALSASETRAAGGDTTPVTTLDVPGINVSTRVHLYGGSLGSNWSGFPGFLSPGYDGAADLDHTFDVYLNWEVLLDFGQCPHCPPQPTPVPLTPPVRLGDQPWFQTYYSAGIIITGIFVENPNGLYTECPDGSDLEAPQFGAQFTPDGKLHVKDIHGGIGTSTRIESGFGIVSGSFSELWLVVLWWNRPQTYTNVLSQLPVDAGPGYTVVRPYHAIVPRLGTPGCMCEYDFWTPMTVVGWSATDVSFASPRYIDAADLAGVASNLGQAVKYGFDINGVPGPRNFEYNVNPWGGSQNQIDSGDISLVNARLGDQCDIGKTAGNETAAILKWFGMAATGSSVVIGPNGETGAEYAVMDSEKLARAIADPYGYKRHVAGAAAQKSTWSLVKKLYR